MLCWASLYMYLYTYQQLFLLIVFLEAELLGQRLRIFSDLRYRFQVPETGCFNRGVSSGIQVQRPRRLPVSAISTWPCLLWASQAAVCVSGWGHQVPVILFTLLWAGKQPGHSLFRGYQRPLLWTSSKRIKTTTSTMPAASLLAFSSVLCDIVFAKASRLLDPFQSQLPQPITQQKCFRSFQFSSNATSSKKPSPL